MRKNIYKTLVACGLASTLTLTGCVEETVPTYLATPSQIASSSSSLEYMLNGLPAFFLTWDTYGTSGNVNDWGYPCQMYMRDVQGEDFPVYDFNYSYWSSLEAASSLRYMYYYTYYYYYCFIKNANNVIGMVDGETATGKPLQYLGSALGYRALCYLDLYRMFEYHTTGYASLDNQAQQLGSIGITVPIVKENTTIEELKHNPRAPFYTMVRFIMTDLNRAEEYTAGFEREAKSYIDQSVVYGLKARLWLDLATRFDKNPDDLSKQLAAENADDGYDALGITTANDCYAKAQEYAEKAIASGYTPLTEDQWTDPTTGFNTVQPSWMLAAMATSKEQVNTTYYWNQFLTQIASEPTWSMGRYGKAFRMISKSLYDQIPTSDWRKYSWVGPDVAGQTTVPSGYRTLLKGDAWSELPAYANIKFRAGSGAIETIETGLIASLPLMRVEEMYFDKFEAMAHTQGVGAAATALQNFVNTYRYTDGSYQCTATDMDSFIDALMVQRRIELWGEGLVFFDYKRLALPITRNYDNTNYLEAARLNTAKGVVAPWMNYVLPETEQDQNLSLILNPDPSGVVQPE